MLKLMLFKESICIYYILLPNARNTRAQLTDEKPNNFQTRRRERENG